MHYRPVIVELLRKPSFFEFLRTAWQHAGDRWEQRSAPPTVSPCCSAKLLGGFVGEEMVGLCAECHLRVVRWNPKELEAYQVRVLAGKPSAS